MLNAQELPPIENFSPIDYNAGNQNWAISQTNNKYIYIANNSGLLEFNGAKWNLYPSPNSTILRSVKVIDNLIYTGCYMEFGYWEKDDLGSLKYHSLVNKLQQPLIEDEQFWNILKFDDWVLFQSLNRIYIYNKNEESFKVFEANTNRAEIFKVGNSIYYQKINEGIFKIENGKSVLVSNHTILQKNVVVGIFSQDKKTLVLTETGEFYYLQNKQLVRWKITADEDLASVSVYSSLQLKDGSFALGTISNGIIHLDKNGNLIRKINQEKGLNNNTILSLFEDNDQNLWLGLDNGVSIINLKSPFSIYNDIKGTLGAVYASKVFNNYLYIGTNQGLFYKEINSPNNFKIIDNTRGQVWCLKEIDAKLFLGHNNGTYVITKNKATQIADFPGTWQIKKLNNQENLLIQGNYNGLSILEKKNNKWSFRNKIEGFDISSRFFEFNANDEVIVNHEYKGIFKLKINSGFTKLIEQKSEPSKGGGSSLIKYNDTLLYISNNGVFKYNNKQKDFIKEPYLTSILFGENDHIKGSVVADYDTHKLWGFTNKNIIYLAQGKFNNTPQAVKIPLPTTLRSGIGITGFENVLHLEDELYLLGLSNGYTIINLNKFIKNDYQIAINSIEKETLKGTKERVLLTKSTEFKSNENNLNFSFSVPEFDKYTEANYQYKLSGLYNDWSSWSNEADVSLKNLPFGDYTFKVRAKVGNILSNNEATYTFKIARPWYISNFMIAIYALCFIGFLFLTHLIYRYYFNKQKAQLIEKKQQEFALAQLESEKVIMKLKNDKLQHKIESKTRELSSSTMNIIKKNEILNTIKNELANFKEDKSIKPVIKLINKNLNNNDDWETFQEAFNNADRDFLQKIKQLHPILTPNDLRLCAYLRMNLSSKEIAPLLNISSRSVEIKRYRLRKKMELLHEESLVEYILKV